MEITQTFVVRAAPDAVWAFLTDPHRVAGCLPGAAITDRVDERTYAGTITVKVGPVATSYRGKVTFERLDPVTRTAEIVATGQDVRGKGGADMRMTSRLIERAPGETEATIVSDVKVTGILAQLGRGMIQDVSDQMFQRFTAAMSAALESAGPAPAASPGGAAGTGPQAQADPIEAVPFAAHLAGRAFVRAVRRPLTWVVVLIVALVIWLVATR
jgi:uncharacterized protein